MAASLVQSVAVLQLVPASLPRSVAVRFVLVVATSRLLSAFG